MLTIIGQDIISGNMGYIGTEPGRLYRMGPQSKVAEASGEPPVVLAAVSYTHLDVYKRQ